MSQSIMRSSSFKPSRPGRYSVRKPTPEEEYTESATWKFMHSCTGLLDTILFPAGGYMQLQGTLFKLVCCQASLCSLEQILKIDRSSCTVFCATVCQVQRLLFLKATKTHAQKVYHRLLVLHMCLQAFTTSAQAG